MAAFTAGTLALTGQVVAASATSSPFKDWGYGTYGSLDLDLAALIGILLSLQGWHVIIHGGRQSRDLPG